MDDLEEIRKLKARYFRGLDTKDWALYESVFAPDVTVDLRDAGGALYEGREAFMEYARSLAIVQSVHQGHMPEIELTWDDSATGIWALEDYNIWEDGTQNHGWGHYRETYRKIDGRWHIQTMKLSYLRIERSIGTAPYLPGEPVRRLMSGANPAKP